MGQGMWISYPAHMHLCQKQPSASLLAAPHTQLYRLSFVSSLGVKRDIQAVMKVKVESHSVVSDSLQPRHSPGQNTGVGNHSLLQGFLPNQGWTQVSHTVGGFKRQSWVKTNLISWVLISYLCNSRASQLALVVKSLLGSVGDLRDTG